MKNEFIEGGKIVGTHGVRGGLRLQPWCDSPQFFCSFKKIFIKENGNYTPLKVKTSKPHSNIVILELNGVDTMEKAELLRGKIVYLQRKDFNLDDDQYLICDLIGCKVFHKDTNESLGVISDVSQTGANDVWHIKKNDKEYLIPAIPQVVTSVDIENSEVIIDPLKGIFEE